MDHAASDRTPVTYDTCDQVSGPFLHGTKATLEPGVDLVAGHTSNFQDGRVSNNIYFTTLESTAAWGRPAGRGPRGSGRSRPHLRRRAIGPPRGRPQRHRQAFPGQPHAVVPDTVRPAGDRGTRRLAGSPARGAGHHARQPRPPAGRRPGRHPRLAVMSGKIVPLSGGERAGQVPVARHRESGVGAHHQ